MDSDGSEFCAFEDAQIRKSALHSFSAEFGAAGAGGLIAVGAEFARAEVVGAEASAQFTDEVVVTHQWV